MRVLQHLSGRQHRSVTVGNCVNTPLTRLRTSRYLSGAFLFAAFIAFVMYGTAPTPAQPSGNKSSASEPASTLHLQAVAPSTTTNLNQSTTSQASSTTNDNGNAAQSNDSSSISTNVTTTNGATSATVNGQPVPVNSDGSINKTVTTNSGTVQINVSQQSAETGSNASRLDYTSDNQFVNTEDSVNGGN